MQDDFYGEPSGASLSWGMPGQRWRGGMVVSVRKAQSTVMGKGTLIITVMSNEKDANNPVDTGMRTIYIEQPPTTMI